MTVSSYLSTLLVPLYAARPVALASLVLLLSTVSSAQANHDTWDTVLKAHHKDGGVDYASLAADRTGLDAYLSYLENHSVSGATDNEAMAFWINAYNAGVIKLVLDRYPGIESVKNENGFFDSLKVRVAGSERTLDEIEDEALAFGDPRVHFAVVCASVGCPDLRFEAYRADRLDQQLGEQTRLFLADTSKGMRFDASAGDIWLSSIFKWYAGDFTGGSTMVAYFMRNEVLGWVLKTLPEAEASRIRSAKPSVKYFDYDWSLNDRKR